MFHCIPFFAVQSFFSQVGLAVWFGSFLGPEWFFSVPLARQRSSWWPISDCKASFGHGRPDPSMWPTRVSIPCCCLAKKCTGFLGILELETPKTILQGRHWRLQPIAIIWYNDTHYWINICIYKYIHIYLNIYMFWGGRSVRSLSWIFRWKTRKLHQQKLHRNLMGLPWSFSLFFLGRSRVILLSQSSQAVPGGFRGWKTRAAAAFRCSGADFAWIMGFPNFETQVYIKVGGCGTSSATQSIPIGFLV